MKDGRLNIFLYTNVDILTVNFCKFIEPVLVSGTVFGVPLEVCVNSDEKTKKAIPNCGPTETDVSAKNLKNSISTLLSQKKNVGVNLQQTIICSQYTIRFFVLIYPVQFLRQFTFERVTVYRTSLS